MYIYTGQTIQPGPHELLRDAIYVYTGQTIQPSSHELNNIYPHEIQDIDKFQENLHTCIGTTHTIDPGFSPADIRDGTDNIPTYVCSGGTLYCNSHTCTYNQIHQDE